MVMVMVGRIGRRSVPRQVSEGNPRDPLLIADADSVMLARAAERNPSVFLPAGPRCNLSENIPKLLGIAEYLDNPWRNTKFLLTQFKPSPAPISDATKSQKKAALEAINRSKSIVEVAEQLGVPLGNGKTVMDEIAARIRARDVGEDTDVFEERREAIEAGLVVDEPEIVESKADVDGWEVGVGQAELVHA